MKKGAMMEEEIKKQEDALDAIQLKFSGSNAHSGMLGIVRALNGMTRALLLLSRVIDKWACEEWDRYENPRRAK